MSSSVGAPDFNSVEWLTHSVEETRRLGAQLATAILPGQIVALRGELGAGKTAFVQGMAQSLGCAGQADGW